MSFNYYGVNFVNVLKNTNEIKHVDNGNYLIYDFFIDFFQQKPRINNFTCVCPLKNHIMQNYSKLFIDGPFPWLQNITNPIHKTRPNLPSTSEDRHGLKLEQGMKLTLCSLSILFGRPPRRTCLNLVPCSFCSISTYVSPPLFGTRLNMTMWSLSAGISARLLVTARYEAVGLGCWTAIEESCSRMQAPSISGASSAASLRMPLAARRILRPSARL